MCARSYVRARVRVRLGGSTEESFRYALGGFDGKKALDEVWRYDAANDTWEQARRSRARAMWESDDEWERPSPRAALVALLLHRRIAMLP